MVVAHILFAMEAFVLKGYSNVVTNVVTNSVGVLRNGTLFCFLLKKRKDPLKWCIWLFRFWQCRERYFLLTGFGR